MVRPSSSARRRLPGLSACLTLLLLLLQGCASSGSGDGPPRRSGNLITAEEMQQTAIGSDAYQVIERLRPAWLRVRSGVGAAVVFLNGQRYGDLDSMRTIPAGDLDSARLLSAADATTLYGTGYPAGIIDLRTRRR